jgi:hypothetical protein
MRQRVDAPLAAFIKRLAGDAIQNPHGRADYTSQLRGARK